MGEAARPEHYARFLETLEVILNVRGLMDIFERELGLTKA
jgi:hypothetical protein